MRHVVDVTLASGGPEFAVGQAEVVRKVRVYPEGAVEWVLLFVAGLLETVWAWTMKMSDGFTRPAMSILTALAMLASIGLLSISMRTLPLGTAYPVWTGIGAVGTFVVGIIVLGEALSATRVLAALLIIAGLILMKAST